MNLLTEDQWETCRDAATMLEHLGLSGWHTARKFRLFCCATARRFAHLTEFNALELLRVAEADAEGVADPTELAKAIACVEEYLHPANNRIRRRRHGWFKANEWRRNRAYAVLLALAPSNQANEWRSSVCIAGLETWPPDEPPEIELAARVDLVRDIFEDPFRPASQRVNPQRLSSTVMALARGIAADQAFDRLPVLSDALEESGCNDPALLNHCRMPSSHVRGCWAVDLLLDLGVALFIEPNASD